jgi:hypothetical protein
MIFWRTRLVYNFIVMIHFELHKIRHFQTPCVDSIFRQLVGPNSTVSHLAATQRDKFA